MFKIGVSMVVIAQLSMMKYVQIDMELQGDPFDFLLKAVFFFFFNSTDDTKTRLKHLL